MKHVLSIAGSDPSGGAGVQADLKTFAALDVYGMAAITALTAQNTKGVFDVRITKAGFLESQINAIFDDIKVDAIKVGMAGDLDTINAIVKAIKRYKPAHLVVDPVMVATSGDSLLSRDSIKTLKDNLIPMAGVLTPNLPEACVLLGYEDTQQNMAKALLELGCSAVLLKGGHGDGSQSIDIFADKKGGFEQLNAARINGKFHGTGCTLSSAIAAFMAKGLSALDACKEAKKYVTRAIQNADKLNAGHGARPLNHRV